MKNKPITFRGHGVYATLGNLYLALIPYAEIKLMEHLMDITKWHYLSENIGITLLIYAVIGALAYPTYLFYEVKHLIDKDNIVGKRDFMAIIYFGSQSILGLIAQVVVFIKVLEIFPITVQFQPLGILIMSFCAAYGGCLGLTNLAVPWPPFIKEHTQVLLKSPKLIWVCIGTTVLLYLITTYFV